MRARLRQLLSRLLVEPPARDSYTGWHDPSRITWGRHSYGAPEAIVYDERSAGRVEVGSFCSIASGVRFLLDGEHRHDFITSSPIPALRAGGPPGHARGNGPIIVGHDVWIGRDATILSGVTIGTGAVIGACAVLASDVRPYAIVVGNPVREMRRRFPDAEIETLLASRWWEWPDEEILANLGLLWSANVEALRTARPR